MTSPVSTPPRRARAAELDPRQLHQIVDRAGGAVRLLEHPVGDPPDRRRVVLVDQRLGEHRQRADGRLELVADVGDEVGADRVDPAPLADVLDERERTAVRGSARR